MVNLSARNTRIDPVTGAVVIARQDAGRAILHLVALVWAVVKVNQCTNDDWKMVLFALLLPELYLAYHYIWKGYISKDRNYCPQFARVVTAPQPL